ncbi:hypothetical protein M413DRAFT_30197 [Hebeloma cylindrosporum]|uniref:Uncharacterized protein n=1 Tax=Hebeloma cylindrosporum TaxID=76867 RepID=A0A0C2YBF4_HEBCY|nr:hypothetical protein M413DRAFT_30197 [Hebeloma cylindrosporum h7]
MVLMPMDVHRRRTIQRKSIVQGPWQPHPVVPSVSASPPSSKPDGDTVNSRPTAPQKRISHRRSSHLYSSSIAASLSMYGQSSRSQQTLQRPVSKVFEETDLDIIKVEHNLVDVNRDSMTPSMESGWTAASYQSTAECVWKDTQWDFVPPPTSSGIEPKWMRFLELEDEGDLAAFSESFEVTLPYLDSGSSTPTTTTPTSATYRPDSPTLTLTSDALPPPPPFQDDTLERFYREERDSLLVLDYDYTAAIDQIVHGDHDHFNDDTGSLELECSVVSGPTLPSHPQHPPEQQRPSFRPGHRPRSSHSSFKTISRRPPSIKRGHGHRLSTSTTQRKDFLVEKGTGAPAVSVRRRSLTKSRRPNGAVRRSLRPAMPGGFNLNAVVPRSLDRQAPVISSSSSLSSRVSSASLAPSLPCVYGQSAAQRSQASSLGVDSGGQPARSESADNGARSRSYPS